MTRKLTIASKLVAAAALSLTAWFQPLQAQRQLTLEDAVELANRNNPTIAQARANIRSAEASHLETLGAFLPTVTATSSASQNSSTRFNPNTQAEVSGSSQSVSAGINANLVVFDGLRRFANMRVSRASVESAEASMIAQEFQITLQTKQAFFSAVAAEELVRVAQSSIRRSAEQLKITSEQLAIGRAIRSDTLRSFVDLSRARLQLVNAETQRETALANLAQLVGLDEPVQVVWDEAEDIFAPIDTTGLRADAASTSPMVYQADAAVRTAGAQVGVSRGGFFPTITASYNTTYSGTGFNFNNLNNSFSFRLGVNLPIFNGFSRETALTRSIANRDAAYAALDDARRQLEAQMTSQFASLRAAELSFQIAQASRLAAIEDLRVQQERFRLGASRVVDVLDSQVNLDQAEVDMVQARLDYLVARAQIEALIGREL